MTVAKLGASYVHTMLQYAHCTYGQNLRFSVCCFLENCSPKKKLKYEMKLKLKHLSIHRIWNDKASSDVCNILEVGGSKYGIHFYINLANGKANGIADNTLCCSSKQ